MPDLVDEKKLKEIEDYVNRWMSITVIDLQPHKTFMEYIALLIAHIRASRNEENAKIKEAKRIFEGLNKTAEHVGTWQEDMNAWLKERV